MQLKSELYKEVETFAQEKSAGEVGRSCLTSLPKHVVSWNFYRLPQIFLSSLHSQNLIYSCILWQIIQLFADVMDRNWVILFRQSLCPALKPRIAKLSQHSPCVAAELCVSGPGGFLVAAKGAVGVHCSVVNRRLMQGFLSFPGWLLGWGHTGRGDEQLGSSCTTFLQLTCGLWLLCQAPAFGFGLFWKENRFFCLTTEAAASGFVVLMLMSSRRVVTHTLNPKVVTKLPDFSTWRKKVKHFEV